MKKSDFWFDLPEELIAQTPIEPRDASRVMLLDKETGATGECVFMTSSTGSIPAICWCSTIPVSAGTSVWLPGGNRPGHMEFLLLKQVQKDVWEVMVRPARRHGKAWSLSSATDA